MDLQSYFMIISTKVWDSAQIKLATHRHMNLQSYFMIISTKVWDLARIELATHRHMDLQSYFMIISPPKYGNRPKSNLQPIDTWICSQTCFRLLWGSALIKLQLDRFLWKNRKKISVFVCFVALLPSKQLWSCREGQFT